jgi:hypothetical protein
MSLYFNEAWKVLLQTAPYLALRVVVYLVLGIGVGIYLGFVYFLAKLFGGGGFLFLIGLAVLWGFLRLLKNYFLYMIQAGHVAVVTELIGKGKLPDGVNQITYGKKVVLDLFKQISVLFMVDQLVKGILRAVNRTVLRVAEIFPLPGLESLARLIVTVFNFSVTYVDESILSYNLSRSREGIWESAKRGVVLYAQNWKPILKTAVGLMVINLLAFAVFFLILLIPLGPLAVMAKSGTWKFFWLVTAAALAFSLKLALINPFSMISMMITFNRTIEGQEPDPEWEATLENTSKKFRQLKEKAMAELKPKGPQPV